MILDSLVQYAFKDTSRDYWFPVNEGVGESSVQKHLAGRDDMLAKLALHHSVKGKRSS